MSRRIRDVVVASFVLGGIGLAVFSYFWFSGRLTGRGRNIYTVKFRDIAGLRIGDPVQVLGIEKGRVTKIYLASNHVEVQVLLDRDYQPALDTRFAIRSVSYLGGDRYLMVTPGDSGAAAPNHVFRGVNESLELETTFLKLDRLLAELNPTELSRALSKSASDLVGTIRTELATVTGDFTNTAGNLSRLAARLDTFVQLVDASSTAGKLVRSDSLYEEVRQTNIELHDLIADIRAHPDKYVKVKFSLFK
ncbi:MCE family protein [candidate division WOR-3 bacterium]|uniref:MCE family protein n=1 Tax=candidate division WOR-3 bacterium TaxID=2052148 RepID=A0A938BS42_UNCW3|nr:MCE family protein [candidate division WOR-3 bacterium]